MLALPRREMCFWPAKTTKYLTFSRGIHLLDTVRKSCYDTWKKWIQLPFIFVLLVKIVDSVIALKFFSSVFQVSGWGFRALQCHGNVCNWNPNLIWTWLRHFWSFSLEYASLCQIYIWMDWNLQELLRCYPFLTTSNFLIVSLRGMLVCSLKMLVLFSHRIL